jgi:DNA-directed RNA polymerase subunit RPC12/RpoP
MVSGKCPKCQEEIQVEQRNMTFFCSQCGEKAMVSHAMALYDYAHPKQARLPEDVPEDQIAEPLPDSSSAENMWQNILSKTNDLTPETIRRLADYAYEDAIGLFTSDYFGVEASWRDSYFEALEASCRMAVEAVDPRVFLELKIYQWYPGSNTFLYPISKDFDIQPILDKELWVDWKPMIEALPEIKRDDFRELCEDACQRIRKYFQSGFANIREMQNGDLSKLMGMWKLKMTTGEIKTDVFHFSQNQEGVPHLEAFRTAVNSYDYYRYIKMSQSSHIIAGEHRHFPSATGTGGDFHSAEENISAMGLMAVYEHIMVLPTALCVRVEPEKIPGFERARVFIDRCRVTPCFHRGDNLKHTHTFRPIIENHETSEPSKRMRNCYVATAVYGDIDAPQVTRLRRYRDEQLNKSRLGRQLTCLYYKIGPKLAGRMSPSSPSSRLVRRFLDGFVKRLDK